MKQWTIMVYMAGDNNLSDDMVAGLIGMKRNLDVASGADVALLAYYDTGALAFPTVKCDFTKNGKAADSKKKRASRPTASPYVEPDGNEKTSAQSIYDFVEWCVEKRGHEAENYALIFSGHGDGFQPATFLSDENPVSSLSVFGLKKVLKKAAKDFLGGKKLGVIGFDSCVMGTLEVAYELADVADLMVASQGLVPNNGWDYGAIAEEISSTSADHKILDKETLAGIFARSFIRAYRDYAFYGARSVDVSVCDLARVAEFGEAVYALGESMTLALGAGAATAKKIEQAILSAHHRAQTHVFEQCVDAFDFCANLRRECAMLLKEAEDVLEIVRAARSSDAIPAHFEELSAASRRIVEACSAAMQKAASCVRQSLYLGAEFQYSNGLSLYFPWSYVSFLISKELYLKRDFAAVGKNKDKSPKPSGWTKFLETYLSKTMRPPRQSSEKEFFLFDLPEKSLAAEEKNAFRLNSPYNKLNSAYNKLNSPYNKLNSPYNKLNSPYNKLNSPYNKLLASPLGDFGRTKNFPWAPTLWQPAEDLPETEDRAPEQASIDRPPIYKPGKMP